MLRCTAHGRWVGFEGLRSLKETAVVSQLVLLLRGQDSMVDLEVIASEWCKSNGLNHDDFKEKTKGYHYIADGLHNV